MSVTRQLDDEFSSERRSPRDRTIAAERRLARFLCVLLLGCGAYVAGCNDGDGSGRPETQEPPEVPGSELTEPQRALLDAHNELRRSALTPPPDPALPPMTWDSRLAAVAQEYADRCVFAHNDARTEQYGTGDYVGENLAIAGGSTAGESTDRLRALFKLWSDEAPDYNYEANRCTDGRQCGHYTQLVWRDSRRVGCGWATCESVQGVNFPAGSVLLVCNYAPGGNYRGSRPY